MDKNSKENPKKEEISKSKKTKKHSNLILGAYLLSVGALLISVLLFFNHQAINKNATAQIEELSKKSQQNQLELTTKLNNLKSDLFAQKQSMVKLKSAQSQLKDSVSNLSQQLTRISKDLLLSDDHWRIVKASQLVELAELNLYWSNAIDSSIVILESADKVLSPIADSGIYEIRKQLQEKITALKILPKLDKVQGLSKLQALQKEIVKLPLIDSQPRYEKPKETTSKTQSDVSKWKNYLNNSLEAIKSIVIIRYHAKPVSPQPVGFQTQQIEKSLLLCLQQASWALIQNKEGLYQFSLKQAQSYLSQYYAQNERQSSVKKQLLKLQQIKLNIPLPKLSGLSSKLEDYLQRDPKTPNTTGEKK